MTNGECISKMNPKQLTTFLFNAEFIRNLAIEKGKSYGEFNVLYKWINSEMTMNLNNINEEVYKQHKKDMGFI